MTKNFTFLKVLIAVFFVFLVFPMDVNLTSSDFSLNSGTYNKDYTQPLAGIFTLIVEVYDNTNPDPRSDSSSLAIVIATANPSTYPSSGYDNPLGLTGLEGKALSTVLLPSGWVFG